MPVEAAVVTQAHPVVAKIWNVAVDVELVAPETGLIVEHGRNRSDNFDRADSKAPFVAVEVIDLLARVENEGASAIVALLVEDDGRFEVVVVVIGPPLELESKVVEAAPGIGGSMTNECDEADEEGLGKFHFHEGVLSLWMASCGLVATGGCVSGCSSRRFRRRTSVLRRSRYRNSRRRRLGR